MTLNSLVALIVPLATLIGASTITPQQRIAMLPILLAAMIASAVLGVAQWAGSRNSLLYFHHYSNRDLPIGFFANRNHQALFLAMALPLLRLWSVLPSRIVPRPRTRNWLAGAAALLVALVVVATGSRSGLVLGVVGVVLAFAILPPNLSVMMNTRASRRRALIVSASVLLALLAVILATVYLGRAVSVTRIAQVGQVESDLRVRYFPIVLGITRDFLPFGSGFGTFQDMFHVYEPTWALKPTNFNHAHNDLLELAMTGGVPSLLALVAFVTFLVVRARAILSWGRTRSASRMAATALLLILMAFAASLTDYPLRAPSIAMLLALASTWLATPLDEAYRPAKRPTTLP